MDNYREVSTITELVAKIKAERTVIHPPKRLRRVNTRRGRKKEFTPEAYARKVERDRMTWAGVSGAWKHLHKTYRSRARARKEPCKWLITMEEWKELWKEAGFLRVGDAGFVTLFALRGKTKDSARVWRINPKGDWVLNNMVVVYGGEIKANGRKVFEKIAQRNDGRGEKE